MHVTNTGSKSIKIGSHFNFIEANKMLEFDRSAAFGMRLVNELIFKLLIKSWN